MSDKTTKNYKKIWSLDATKKLKGLFVTQVRWMTDKEVKEFDWHRSAPVIEFNNGVKIIASMDDEGNDAGALFTNHKDLQVLPVI